MLTEYFLNATTACPKHLRDMGYLRELIGIRARLARCEAAWAPHLDQCHWVIMKWAEAVPSKKRVVVMGAALRYDLPLQGLSQQFDEVVLIDLMHPWWARRGEPEKVQRLSIDVTGGLKKIFTAKKSVAVSPPALPDADLYLSVNLLSQLTCVSGDWLRSQGIADEDINAWSVQVMDQHLDLLSGLNAPVGLISEFYQETRRGEEVIESVDVLDGIKAPEFTDRWDWLIAPKGEASPHTDILLRVGAVLMDRSPGLIKD